LHVCTDLILALRRFFLFQAEDGIRDRNVTGVQTCALPISACSGNNDAPDDSDELASLDVDFQLPESADLEETVELKAIVTYGDEKVTDAEVEFEYWEKGDEENSTRIEAENNEDGTYTEDVSFDRDG